MFRAQTTFLNETKVAFLDSQKQPFAFIIQRLEDVNYGDLYQGKIEKKIPLLKSFFVNINKDKNVFLPSSEQLNEGDYVIVQVTKEARLGKEAEVKLINIIKSHPIGLIEKGKLLTPNQLTLPEIPWNEYFDDILSDTCNPIVSFADGARLIIERTSAFWSIDIDSASSSLPFSKINQEAVPIIAKEIIKRNLNGNIIIDFIGRKNIKNISPLLIQLNNLLLIEATPFQIGGLSRLGNVEMKRDRRRSALIDILTSPNAKAYTLFKSILNIPSPFLTIHVSPYLYKQIIGPLAQTWNLLEQKKGTRLVIKADPTETSFTIKENLHE